MQAKCGSKKTHAINLAKFFYFVISVRLAAGSDISAANNFLFGHLRPIIHIIRRKMIPQLLDIEN